MRVYLDNAATTIQYPEVAETVRETSLDCFANASSLHSFGRDARRMIEWARETAADFIGANPREIFFTSGATESNNWALRGTAIRNADRGRHIITTKIEHHSVLSTCEALMKEGFDVTFLDVDEKGSLDIRKLKDAIREDTVLISVMTANNEIGTVEPIKEIGEIAHKKDIVFHTDAVQAIGKMDIDVNRMNADLMSVSAHKFHGPKGVGFLYIKEGTKIDNLMYGGNQEKGRRPGTYSTPAVAGLGRAVEITSVDMEESVERMTELRDLLIDGILENVSGSVLNGERTKRLCNNVNISFEGIDSESLLYRLDMKGIACSTGSACMADSGTSSHVIEAIGGRDGWASARFSLSRYTTREEIEYTVDAVKEAVETMRKRPGIF